LTDRGDAATLNASMDYQKVDTGLAAALAEAGDANAPPFDVFVHLTKDLTTEQIAALERAGVAPPKPGRDIVTARLGPAAIRALSAYPWVRFLRLSSRARLLG
jgi:hypothetical protein